MRFFCENDKRRGKEGEKGRKGVGENRLKNSQTLALHY
jgi:hypothetical protein